MIQIGNDGNLLPHPVPLTELDEMGIAERYDIVIDFSRYAVGQKVYMVNLTEQTNGKKPDKDLSLSDALAGKSNDPVVGKFLEFRVVRRPATPDLSQVPATLIPNPVLPAVSRTRTFEWGRGAQQTTSGPTAGTGPWGVKTDNGAMLDADYGRISAMPRFGTTEQWVLKNGGGGWDHPIHIHFEEGQGPGPQRQRLERTSLGERPQGRVPSAPLRHRHDRHAVPRLGRHVHGALPQHGARRQRHADALGDQRQRRAVPAPAADAHPHAAGGHVRPARRDPSDRAVIASTERRR
jgi:hypothetical protein